MCIGCRVGLHEYRPRARTRATKDEVVSHCGINPQTTSNGLAYHPIERNLRKPALRLRISSADIRMHTREPDLLNILLD